MKNRTRTRLFIALGVLAAVAAVLLAFLWWGPVTVGDKRMLLDFLLGRGITPPTARQVDERLEVPPGFTLQLYSADVPLARFMAVTAEGDLLVTRTRADVVSILERDRDGDGAADGHRVLMDGLDGPHGIALHEGWLYVAERTAVGRARFDSATGQLAGPYQHILTGLTTDGFHQTKTIGFGPDGWLYLSQGSSCNACVEQDPRRATIMRMHPDGSEAAIHATGLRNSVDFDWSPWDQALYATENGRDLLGDDLPPDELNRIEAGGFYGWPYMHGFGIADPDLGGEYRGEAPPIHPVHGFRAHNAPLGIRFLHGPVLPTGYERVALVALHGSWNRSTLDGYKVVSLHWLTDGTVVEKDFLTGFLGPDGVIGRPAGIAQGPDGTIFVSDDYAGAIYRISPDMPDEDVETVPPGSP